MTETKEDEVRNFRHNQAPPNGIHEGRNGEKPGKAMKQCFSMKAERRRQENATWETKGDEDLIGNVKGKFGLKRIFWNGSLDSQGCLTASSIEVKDIFRHCIRVLYGCSNVLCQFRVFILDFSFDHFLSVKNYT